MDYRLVATKYYYGAGAAVCEEEFIHADSTGRLGSGLGLGSGLRLGLGFIHADATGMLGLGLGIGIELRLGLGLGLKLGFIHADSTGRLVSELAPNPKP